MASSKNLFLLSGLLLVLLFLISSQVSASRDQTTESMEVDGKRGGYGYGYRRKGHGGGGGSGYPGHGGGYPGKGGGGYPGKGCRYGCCRGYRYGSGCKRCCATAHEAPEAQFEDDFHN